MKNNSKTIRGGVTVQNGRSMFFIQSFVKSRLIETRRSERVPLQIVSLKTPKMSSHFGMSSKARWKYTLKNPLTLRIFASIQSGGPSLTSRGISWRIDNGKRGKKRNYWGQLCFSRSVARRLFSMEISPVNLCKLLFLLGKFIM